MKQPHTYHCRLAGEAACTRTRSILLHLDILDPITKNGHRPGLVTLSVAEARRLCDTLTWRLQDLAAPPEGSR